MLSAAISEVNWYEIAEHFIADVDQTVEESDEYEEVIENPRAFLDSVIEHMESKKTILAAILPVLTARNTLLEQVV